ncbi:MAG: D-arabinono-1,4-lactone oxidase [Chitinophagales bacterium]
MIHQQKYNFTNWGKNIQREVANYFQPETEDEIIQIVQQYDKIRVVGSGHSWSDICATNEALISFDKFNKILKIDKQNKIVRTQPGIKLWQLNEQLDKVGLALINLGSIDQQSIVGATSTGTHGTGIDFQILGSQILELTLINANGEKLIINKEKDKELYAASIVNLGCLGIISEVVLQVTDAFQLHEYTTTIPFDEVIENLDTLLVQNDHFKLWWLPPADKVVVYKYNRTQEKPNDSKLRAYINDIIFSVYIYRFLVFTGKIIPALAKTINNLLTNGSKGPIDRIEKSYKVFVVPEPPKHRETEWAFDVANAKEILKSYKQFMLENKFKLNFIQEIRFSKADNFWLSASNGRNSMWLGLYAYEHEHWDTVLPKYEDFAKQHNGRPHWGKEFSADKNYLAEQYEKYNDFIALKQQFDPNKKFENNYIERLFS